MGYVSSDMTTAMRTSVKALFLRALGEMAVQAPFNQWEKIASRLPSDSDQEEYNWLGATPPMNEWIDERKLRGLRPYSYTLKNKDWEATLEINRNAFNDNKLGHVPMRVRGLDRSYIKAILKAVFQKLNGGPADADTFDAGYFFKDDRTIGDSGTIDNIAAGSYAASAANIRAGLADAASKMMNYKDDWGEPLGLMPDTIICAPKKFLLIQEALQPGVAGVIRPEAAFVKQIIVSPWLTAGATAGHDWYLANTTEEIKPIIFQERQKPEVTSLDKPDDRDVFMRKMLLYGIDARFVVGFGDPRTCVLVDCSD